MKKIVSASVAGLAALALAPLAEASIMSTAHQTNVGAAGPCSACHIPHGGGAQRLWPASTGTATYTGVVAGLCGSCHNSTGGYATNMTAAKSDSHVYAATSHGTLMNVGNLPWGTTVTSSGLPYAAATTNIECTSCHDVHNDTVRPFLRDTMNQICARCHTNRHFVGATLSQGATVTAGAWGLTNVGLANPGSHPVGTDITLANNSGGGSVIVAAPTNMTVAESATAGAWSLGGHLTGGTTGGVTCVTCHAVHGNMIDATTEPTTGVPGVNFLAVEQASATLGGGVTTARSVASGQGATNTLCEACHGGTGNNPTTVPGGGAFTSTYAVNPGGASTFSHPIDNYPSSIDAGVAAFGTGWPVGGGFTAPTNVNPIPICESCHMAHPLADNARADNNWGTQTVFDYILRGPASSICDTCHTSSPANHHPLGMPFDATGVTYLPGMSAGGSQTLVCSVCHGGSGAAHNWAGASQVAIAGGWKPAGNGRNAAQATDMYNADMGKTCMDCHYGMDGTASSVNPTLGASTDSVVSYETEFQRDGLGTHYIGLVHTAATTWKGSGTPAEFVAPRVNIFDTGAQWSAASGYGAAANGWARFGGTSSAPVLVCESCHELQPSRNKGIKHLLLAAYTEGSNGVEPVGQTGPAGRDGLCEACHGVPNGTHALSDMTVSRTGAALNTGASWIRNPVLGYATVGTNDLSCDSCHQPHDANTNSSTFMLDAPASGTEAPLTGITLVGAGTVDGTNPSVATGYALTTYATPTLSGRGGDFTGYCDQCHTYAY